VHWAGDPEYPIWERTAHYLGAMVIMFMSNTGSTPTLCRCKGSPAITVLGYKLEIATAWFVDLVRCVLRADDLQGEYRHARILQRQSGCRGRRLALDRRRRLGRARSAMRRADPKPYNLSVGCTLHCESLCDSPSGLHKAQQDGRQSDYIILTVQDPRPCKQALPRGTAR